MSAPDARMRLSAQPAWSRLQAALERVIPDCLGDERFVAERTDLEPEDRADMALACSMCPLFSLCDEYHVLGKPRGGFWAGVAS